MIRASPDYRKPRALMYLLFGLVAVAVPVAAFVALGRSRRNTKEIQLSRRELFRLSNRADALRREVAIPRIATRSGDRTNARGGPG